MSINMDELITIKGYKMIDFQQKFPIYESTNVELKGKFRSLGEDKDKSIIYFGLHCFDEKGKDILSESVNRTRESLLITSINSDLLGFTLDKKPETWNNSSNPKENDKKLIGIYYDGNINKLPDYLINYPAYDNYESNNIKLNTPIPKEIYDKIKPFTTRVMNHYCSSMYDYSAASHVTVENKWTEFKAIYNGFSEGYGDIKGKFRPGTKEISPFILANYDQNEKAVLEVKDIELIIKEKPKIIIK